MIKDPYIAENYKDAEWVGRKDYFYVNEFKLTQKMVSYQFPQLKKSLIDLNWVILP